MWSKDNSPYIATMNQLKMTTMETKVMWRIIEGFKCQAKVGRPLGFILSQWIVT